MIEMTVALIVFLFPLAYSPGPGNMFFAANGARFGVAATLPASAGYHVATWVVTAAIGIGFTAATGGSPELLSIVKWAGSAYVLYLASKLVRAGTLEDAGKAQPAGFMTGVALLVLNPKAYLIIALMFSQFLAGPQLGDVAAIFWISTVFTLNNLVAFVAWSIVGDKLAARFRDESDARKLNLFFGSVLAAVALWTMFR